MSNLIYKNKWYRNKDDLVNNILDDAIKIDKNMLIK